MPPETPQQRRDREAWAARADWVAQFGPDVSPPMREPSAAKIVVLAVAFVIMMVVAFYTFPAWPG